MPTICQSPKNTILRIKNIVDIQQDITLENLDQSVLEEFEEYMEARHNEQHHNEHYNEEPSKVEAVDLAICALACYFKQGGSLNTLIEDLNRKLDKWQLTSGMANAI